MNDISKSIRVGTVDFFGIMIPGTILVAVCIIGFFVPLVSVVMDLSRAEIAPIVVDTNGLLLILFLLIIFSYVFGYILRLSSPDTLDRKSAKKVIREECGRKSQETASRNILEKLFASFRKWVYSITNARQIAQKWIEEDGWPFDPSNPRDKYPYLNFRRYLEKRGHQQLAREMATWESEENVNDGSQHTERSVQKSLKSPKPVNKIQRSKTNINKMKMSIGLYCPELSALVESKEAHIRLMSGTWAAFKFSQWPIWIALIILTVIGLAPQWVELVLPVKLSGRDYFVFMFINLNLLLVIYFCNQRIEKLFHYRRVSELFHIVQAASFAEQIKQRVTAEYPTQKVKKRK